MAPAAHVHFVVADLTAKWPDMASLSEQEMVLHPARFRTGIDGWIVETFLYLKSPLLASGVTTSIGPSIQSGVINLVHRDDLNGFSLPARTATIVGVRADRPPFRLADFEIVQNDLCDLEPHQTYIPFWPQPGIIARSGVRGETIENAAYMGNLGTLSPWFADQQFVLELDQLALRLRIEERAWHDFSQIDLVMAHRREAPCMLLHKPVSKLTNAWLAEVPALLNDEPAYLKLRTDPLDYISIDSAQDVFSAVRWLRSTPGMFWAMVERGRKRGVEYTVDALRARWMNLFLDVVIPRDPEIRRRKTWSEQVWRLGSQKIQSRVFKRRYRLEIASGARLPTPRLEGGVQTLGQAPRR